jgi:hypothetical protein
MLAIAKIAPVMTVNAIAGGDREVIFKRFLAS